MITTLLTGAGAVLYWNAPKTSKLPEILKIDCSEGNHSFKKNKTHPCFFNNGLFYGMGFVNWGNF